jgi:hypothetical protein
VSSPAVSWQRLLTLEILQLHTLRSSVHSLLYRTLLELAFFPLLITENTAFLTVTLMLCVYSLPRKRVYKAVTQKRSLFTESPLGNGSIRQNTETWSSRLGVGRKTHNLALLKIIVARSREVKTGPKLEESYKESCGSERAVLLMIMMTS